MRNAFILITIWWSSIIAAPDYLSPKVELKPEGLVAPRIEIAPISISSSKGTGSLPEADSVLPKGPADLRREYEAGMAAVANRFSAELRSISQAVDNVRMTSDEAEFVTHQRYQEATIEFQLLSALQDIPAPEMARRSIAQDSAISSPAPDAIVVALPFSSLQLNSSVSRYLGLNATQQAAIQELMSNERRTFEPLLEELRAIGQQIRTLKEWEGAREKRALAAAQAETLTKIILENSRMQDRIYALLTAVQRNKLDDLKRAMDLSERTAEQ